MTFTLQAYQTIVSNRPEYRQVQQIPLSVWESIPSTNQKLWELIDQGNKPPLAAIALQQTAGRGQWGKQWQSPPGGLYLSLAITPQIPISEGLSPPSKGGRGSGIGEDTSPIAPSACTPRDNPHLVIATAWGIATVLRQDQLPVSLKWPNDLILAGRKLGGIKIETRIQQQHLTHAVIGVGINWANPVPAVGINLESYYRSTKSKKATAKLGLRRGGGHKDATGFINCGGDRPRRPLRFPRVTPPCVQAAEMISGDSPSPISSLEQLTAITLNGILSGYHHYLAVGIEQILAEYHQLLFSMGQKVTLEGNTGVVTGVTAKGELKVRLQSPGAATEVRLPPGQISLGYLNIEY